MPGGRTETLDAANGAGMLYWGGQKLPGVGKDVVPEGFLFVEIIDEAHFEGLLRN